MKVWFVLLALFSIGASAIKANDSRTELIACGSTLFQLAAIRISHQFAEFEECKRSDADASNAKDCSESIKRATADLQQGLHDYNHCTKDIR